eukprot:3055729-Rhodomonas_salina.1
MIALNYFSSINDFGALLFAQRFWEQSRKEMVKQTEQGSGSEQTGAETQLTARQEETSAPNEEPVRQLTYEEVAELAKQPTLAAQTLRDKLGVRIADQSVR